MDIPEIRQGIALLPPTAQSKPLLDALLTLVEPLLSSPHVPTLAAMRQEIDALRAPKVEQSQEHPRGLCGESTCGSCVTQAQELVSLGRGQVQSDIDQALEWFGGPALQGKIAIVVKSWMDAGQPQPTAKPELDIALE